MQVKVDVTHGNQKTTVTVDVPDELPKLQGLRLMHAAEKAARAHAEAELDGEVTRMDFLQIVEEAEDEPATETTPGAIQ